MTAIVIASVISFAAGAMFVASGLWGWLVSLVKNRTAKVK